MWNARMTTLAALLFALYIPEIFFHKAISCALHNAYTLQEILIMFGGDVGQINQACLVQKRQLSPSILRFEQLEFKRKCISLHTPLFPI